MTLQKSRAAVSSQSQSKPPFFLGNFQQGKSIKMSIAEGGKQDTANPSTSTNTIT